MSIPYIDQEIRKLGRFFTCHSMHSLLTHTMFYSPQDVLRIEEFEPRITVRSESVD